MRTYYRICRVYLPIIVDGPDAFLFALSVEPVVLFIYLFSWSCSPPEHDHIPQFDECGIEQDFGSNVSYVIQRWYVYELEDIAVAKYLHPFLSNIDVFHSRFDDCVVGKIQDRRSRGGLITQHHLMNPNAKEQEDVRRQC